MPAQQQYQEESEDEMETESVREKKRILMSFDIDINHIDSLSTVVLN